MRIFCHLIFFSKAKAIIFNDVVHILLGHPNRIGICDNYIFHIVFHSYPVESGLLFCIITDMFYLVNGMCSCFDKQFGYVDWLMFNVWTIVPRSIYLLHKCVSVHNDWQRVSGKYSSNLYEFRECFVRQISKNKKQTT